MNPTYTLRMSHYLTLIDKHSLEAFKSDLSFINAGISNTTKTSDGKMTLCIINLPAVINLDALNSALQNTTIHLLKPIPNINKLVSVSVPIHLRTALNELSSQLNNGARNNFLKGRIYDMQKEA